MTPQMQEMKISLLERENYQLSNKAEDVDEEKNELLEHNLKRFEEERKQFEMEKLKFLEDKRELDRLRLQRFERYKRELEAKRLGIRPNYDIDNPNDYAVARRVVNNLIASTPPTQDSGSESEPDVTVVENLPPQLAAPEVEFTPPAATATQLHDNGITPDNGLLLLPNVTTCDENRLGSNKDSQPNGTEKADDAVAATLSADEMKLEKVEFDEANPMRFWPFCRLLMRETRQTWRIHRRLHPREMQHIMRDVNKCLSEFILLMMFCGLGGVVFRYIEGNFELANKTGVKRVKRDFIDQLWLSSHNLR